MPYAHKPNSSMATRASKQQGLFRQHGSVRPLHQIGNSHNRSMQAVLHLSVRSPSDLWYILIKKVADLLVVDLKQGNLESVFHLTPSEMCNLEEFLQCPVVDAAIRIESLHSVGLSRPSLAVSENAHIVPVHHTCHDSRRFVVYGLKGAEGRMSDTPHNRLMPRQQEHNFSIPNA